MDGLQINFVEKDGVLVVASASSPMYCDPAASIIAAFDHLDEREGPGRRVSGATLIAQHLGIACTTVTRWRRPRDKQGTGGFIPWKYRGRIRKMAEIYEKTLVSFD